MSGALWGPPSNLRLVVLDLETCVAPGGAHRIVAIGIAICRGGAIKQRYAWLVDPGVPVDPATAKIHKLTDAVLADEPPLDEVLPDIEPLLTPRNGERIVLAAHNTRFDVPVLRAEIARVGGRELPDLPLLDTMGQLVSLAGVKPKSRKLEDLLVALGLTNTAPHDALGDASATALAACQLLERAETAGYADLNVLLQKLNAGAISSVKPTQARARAAHPDPVVPLPPAHVATHSKPLMPNPNGQEWETQRDWIAECAALRCDGLAARGVGIPHNELRTLLFDVLVGTVAAGDKAAMATVLGALSPILGTLPESVSALRSEGPAVVGSIRTRGRRGVAVALHAWIEAMVAPFGRCEGTDLCPSCRNSEPCPLDTWRTGLVASAIGDTEGEVVAFWNTRLPGPGSNGSGRGYASMKAVAPDLADLVLRRCYAFYIAKGDRTTGAQLADQTWRQAGCRDPLMAEARATLTAAHGQTSDIAAAIRDCRRTLATRGQNTDPAWDNLAVRAAALNGRLARLSNPTRRSHQATKPARPPRRARFSRAA
jgi:DNA polymerase-3 subunit epsilon